MGLLEQIQRDVQQITTDSRGFAQPVVFTTPGGTVSKTVNAVAVKHSTSINEFGAPVRGKTARVTVSEHALYLAGYPVRNPDNTVNLKDHKVVWTDSENISYTYVINEIQPDRRVGMIVCTLGDYKTGSEPRKVIGWKPCLVQVIVTATPNPANTQLLDNGDIIPKEYALNVNGTLTIPYLVSVTGIGVLTPFMLDNSPMGTVPYSAGTFTYPGGSFQNGNNIEINASLPLYQL